MFANRFERLFNDLFSDDLLYSRSRQAQGPYPAVNLWQGEKGLLLTARLPGIKAEELEISVAGADLTISAKHGEEFSFSRSFSLPTEVDSSKVAAQMHDGILELEMPLAERAQPKKIAVSTAAPEKQVTCNCAG